MPVTIGTLNSNMNLVDTNSMLNEAVMEQIIQITKARLKQEMSDEDRSRQERGISDRMTKPDIF